MTSETFYDREELAWAAGFFDGEGCVRAAESQLARGRYGLRLIVSQCDPRPIERFARAMCGMGRMYGPYRIGPNSQKWEWRVQRFEQAQMVVAMLWRWLSEPKREQAKRAFAMIHGQRAARDTSLNCPRIRRLMERKWMRDAATESLL